MGRELLCFRRGDGRTSDSKTENSLMINGLDNNVHFLLDTGPCRYNRPLPSLRPSNLQHGWCLLLLFHLNVTCPEIILFLCT